MATWTWSSPAAAGSPTINLLGFSDGHAALFRNDGDFHFSEQTTPAGLDLPIEYSQGCAVTDYNADGFPDLFVCCYGRSRLYANLGDGTFVEATTASQLPAEGWGTAAAFGDLDRDGLPDLMLARYTDWTPATDIVCYNKLNQRDLCGPNSYPGVTAQFFHNLGDGSFADVSADLGMQDVAHGLGVVVTDVNNDGLLDFYVSSDALPNLLYLGEPDGRLTERGTVSGVAYGEWGQPEAGMGIDIGDYNGDATLDIFVTNYENEDNALYHNTGQGHWLHRTVITGLSGVSRMRVGFGTSLCDFDNDGWLDLFVLNGNSNYSANTPYQQEPQLFANLEGRRFVERSEQGGPYFGEAHSGRGSAAGDLNNDGAMDLVTILMNEPVRILRNRQPPENYVAVQLIGRLGDREATGARVSCEFDGRTLVRWVTKGAGYFSQGDGRIVLPIDDGSDRVDVQVTWLDRGSEVFRLAMRRTHQLVEGRGVARD